MTWLHNLATSIDGENAAIWFHKPDRSAVTYGKRVKKLALAASAGAGLETD
jgi:hypothetical protein